MEKNESLEDRVQGGLREAATNILQGIPKILMEMKDVLAEVSQWSDERVFSERFFVEMNGIDAIVRLIGFWEKCDDPDHAVGVAYSKAREIFENLDDSVVTLFAMTNDSGSIATLLMIWFLYLRIENEIHERLKSRKVGLSFMRFLHLHYNSQKPIDDLLDQTRKQINAWLRSRKISTSPETKKLLGALNPKWGKTFLKKQTINRSESYAEDFRNDVLLKYEDWFSQHMEELKKQNNLENVEETLELYRQCYSILKDERPLNNPAWDDFAPRALCAMLGLLLLYLPMLTGKTERIPGKIYNDLRTRLRRFSKEINLSSIEIELLKVQKQSDSQLVEEVIRDLLHKNAFKDKIDKIIAENYGKSDREAAGIIFEATGRSITKQAVRKRRIDHVESIIKPPLEIRKTMMEDQERDEEKRIDAEDEEESDVVK